MARHQSIGRRSVLQAAGSIALMGGLAGCLSAINEPESIESWLNSTDNYEGTIKDKTGVSSVAVTVGPDKQDTPKPLSPSENETHQKNHTTDINIEDVQIFVPAAIKISPGTTVTWKWEGYGAHNVVGTDGGFNSGEPEGSGTFTHTFESAGQHYYYCEPHKEGGMKGVVVVADSGTQSGTPTR